MFAGDRPFNAAQAWQDGLSRAEIRRRVRCGEWVVLRRGVYVERAVLARASTDGERHALELAGLLSVLEFDAVGGGVTAARIWELDLLRSAGGQLVVVTDDPDAVSRRRSDHVLRTAALSPEHCETAHGVPVTSVARTVVDIARTATFAEGVVVADSALHMRMTAPGELHRVLDACSGWPGVQRARRVVEFADGNSESVLESVSRVAMHERGITPPHTQVVVGDARVDFLWDDVRVIGEADGLGKYEADGARMTRDIVRAEKRREERLADAGFEVVRWGWEDARNPVRLAHRLRAAFARGAERQRGRATG